jgi:hypothetical protein
MGENNNDNDGDEGDAMNDVEEMRLLPISNDNNNDIILALHTIINNPSSSSSSPLSSVDVLNYRMLDGTTRATTTTTSTSRSIPEMINLFLHGYPTNPTP